MCCGRGCAAGILNKARRGELAMPLPIGFVYDASSGSSSIPISRCRRASACSVRTFRRTGSATATVKAFREQGLAFPRRVFHRPTQGGGALG